MVMVRAQRFIAGSTASQRSNQKVRPYRTCSIYGQTLGNKHTQLQQSAQRCIGGTLPANLHSASTALRPIVPFHPTLYITSQAISQDRPQTNFKKLLRSPMLSLHGLAFEESVCRQPAIARTYRDQNLKKTRQVPCASSLPKLLLTLPFKRRRAHSDGDSCRRNGPTTLNKMLPNIQA